MRLTAVPLSRSWNNYNYLATRYNNYDLGKINGFFFRVGTYFLVGISLMSNNASQFRQIKLQPMSLNQEF